MSSISFVIQLHLSIGRKIEKKRRIDALLTTVVQDRSLNV